MGGTTGAGLLRDEILPPSLIVGVRAPVRRLILLKLLFLAPPQQTTGKGLTKEKISIKILASVMS